MTLLFWACVSSERRWTETAELTGYLGWGLTGGSLLALVLHYPWGSPNLGLDWGLDWPCCGGWVEGSWRPGCYVPQVRLLEIANGQ